MPGRRLVLLIELEPAIYIGRNRHDRDITNEGHEADKGIDRHGILEENRNIECANKEQS